VLRKLVLAVVVFVLAGGAAYALGSSESAMGSSARKARHQERCLGDRCDRDCWNCPEKDNCPDVGKCSRPDKAACHEGQRKGGCRK